MLCVVILQTLEKKGKFVVNKYTCTQDCSNAFYRKHRKSTYSLNKCLSLCECVCVCCHAMTHNTNGLRGLSESSSTLMILAHNGEDTSYQ